MEAQIQSFAPRTCGTLQLADGQIEIFTDKEACSFLGVSAITLWRERKAGRLSYRRVGNGVRYTRGDLESYLESVKQSAFAVAA